MIIVSFMSTLNVKTEFLPERCEICHQSDQFAPKTSYCFRCSTVSIDGSENDEIAIEVRALQLLYFLSGGAGLILGYASWSIFYYYCGSIQKLLYPRDTPVLGLVGLVAGGLIGWGAFS